jgi:plasmid maintenance system antidote protein VapI
MIPSGRHGGGSLRHCDVQRNPIPAVEALRKFPKLEGQKAELTQAELAQRLGWDQTTISDIETGPKRVTAIELIQLGKALGFNPGAALNRIAEVYE